MCNIRTQNQIKNRMDYLNLVNAVINRQSNPYDKSDILMCVKSDSAGSAFHLSENEIGKMIDDSIDFLYSQGLVLYEKGKFLPSW